MWRQRERNREAARIADQLRPRDDPMKRRPEPARPQSNSDKLLEALNQTTAPMSKHGFVRYLQFLAIRRPRTILALLGRIQRIRRTSSLNRTDTRNPDGCDVSNNFAIGSNRRYMGSRPAPSSSLTLFPTRTPCRFSQRQRQPDCYAESQIEPAHWQRDPVHVSNTGCSGGITTEVPT
jgi:hypothetical protein